METYRSTQRLNPGAFNAPQVSSKGHLAVRKHVAIFFGQEVSLVWCLTPRLISHVDHEARAAPAGRQSPEGERGQSGVRHGSGREFGGLSPSPVLTLRIG